jgi:addiction module HigA family antidote
MSIPIEHLDTLDFSDVADTQLGKFHPIHPGEVLREEFLLPLNMSVSALALALRVPATRLHEIVKERRAITPDTALRLARYFGGDAQFWLNLQTSYNLRLAQQNTLSAIEREVLPREARYNTFTVSMSLQS